MSSHMMHVETLININSAATQVYEKHVVGKPFLGGSRKTSSLSKQQVILARALFYLKGMHYKEVAKIIGVSPKTVHPAIHHATYKSVVAPFEKPRMSRGKIVWDIDTNYDFEYEESVK